MGIIQDLLLLLVLIFFGYLGGEIISKFKLPKVLGYLFVGMIIGPYALGLFDISRIADSALIKTLLAIAFGYVGYSIGAGIRLDELKEAGIKMLILTFFEAYVPFFLVIIAMLAVGFDFMVSLVIGSIALATAPVTALSISQEYKTDGPVTRTLMPIVALDDILAVITFGVVLAFAGSYYSGESGSFIEPFIEVFLSIGVGLGFGFITYYLVRNIKGKTAMFINVSAAILLTMVASILLHAEAIMAGITFGVVLVNMLSEKSVKLFNDATSKIIGMSVLVFMVLIGTTLDIAALFNLTVLAAAAIYIVVRGFGKIFGARFGAKITKQPKAVSKYLGFTLLAAAGVSLTFVGLASGVLPEDQAIKMSAMIAAAAIINELIAVFATKWAFDKAGEINQAK